MADNNHEPETILDLEGGFLDRFLEANPGLAELPLDERVERMILSGINQQTRFFRDDQAFKIFRDMILPAYSPSQSLHVASVGCSDGREAYSLLLENWRQNGRLSLDAFDVNPANIETAQRGEYDASADPYEGEMRLFEALGPEAKKAYGVTAVSNKDIPWLRFNDSHVRRISFNDEAKARINFQTHNILRGPLPQQYDVVLLLNVLMHYNPSGRESILANVHRSMREGGWLLCETADWSDPFPGRRQYFRGMEDLDNLGFENAHLPYFETRLRIPQVYRRKEILSPSP
jgi:chemotaxis protein methyltransferase CheR